jgi:hypothetical protein
LLSLSLKLSCFGLVPVAAFAGFLLAVCLTSLDGFELDLMSGSLGTVLTFL